MERNTINTFSVMTPNQHAKQWAQKPLCREHAMALNIAVTLYHRYCITLSHITSSIEAIHVINSRVLSLSVLHAGSSGCC